MTENEKHLTLNELHTLQNAQDQKIILEHAVEQAKEGQAELETDIRKYFFQNPGNLADVFCVLLAVFCIWCADIRYNLVSMLNSLPFFEKWAKTIVIAVITLYLCRLCVCWFAITISENFAKGKYSYKFRRENINTTYKEKGIVAAATLRQAEQELKVFTTRTEKFFAENSLSKPFCDADALAELIQLMEEKQLDTLEQGAAAYQLKKEQKGKHDSKSGTKI